MQAPFHKLLFYTLVIALLAGCSTGNKFASLFGKRRYTKGYFADIPSRQKATQSMPGIAGKA